MSLNFATVTVPTLLLWIVGLLLFGVGALLGYFNMAIDARKKAESADLKVENAREDARKKLAEAERLLKEAKSLGANVPQAGDGRTLLKMIEGANFRTQIEMDGKPLSAPLTPERKRRLLELVNHFRPWIETADAPAPQPRPASSAPMVVSAPEPVPTPEVKPVSMAFPLAQPKPKPDPATEFKLLSMVKQIDVVLQRRIAGTALEPYDIHLQDAPSGGLEVVIGEKKFDTIDDVPDANVKSAIRAAIAEWEQKYVPGA